MLLRTNYFSGPNQFIIQQSFVLISDLYLTIFRPLMWCWSSIKSDWAGWGGKNKMYKFHYVRKPDIERKKKLERFNYFRHKPVREALPLEITAKDNAVYVVMEPKEGPVFSLNIPLCQFYEDLSD